MVLILSLLLFEVQSSKTEKPRALQKDLTQLLVVSERGESRCLRTAVTGTVSGRSAVELLRPHHTSSGRRSGSLGVGVLQL